MATAQKILGDPIVMAATRLTVLQHMYPNNADLAENIENRNQGIDWFKGGVNFRLSAEIAHKKSQNDNNVAHFKERLGTELYTAVTKEKNGTVIEILEYIKSRFDTLCEEAKKCKLVSKGLIIYNQACMLYHRKDWNNALPLLQHALTVFTEENDSTSLAICHSTIASCYRNLNRFDDAKKSCETALEICEKNNVDQKTVDPIKTKLTEILKKITADEQDKKIELTSLKK